MPEKTEGKTIPKIEGNSTAANLPVKTETKETPVVAAATVVPTQAIKTFAQGLLYLKLLETRGLKMPADSNVTPGGPSGKDIGCLPFAVIEMDKNEVIMRAVEANPANNTVIFGTKANL